MCICAISIPASALRVLQTRLRKTSGSANRKRLRGLSRRQLHLLRRQLLKAQTRRTRTTTSSVDDVQCTSTRFVVVVHLLTHVRRIYDTPQPRSLVSHRAQRHRRTHAKLFPVRRVLYNRAKIPFTIHATIFFPVATIERL